MHQGVTDLMAASLDGNTDIAKALVAAGANIEARDEVSAFV